MPIEAHVQTAAQLLGTASDKGGIAMGLFGKLFEKKECAICGGESGLLGNRKLEDGNMCKACASKLSPWFDERRHSTVEQIESQLAYREANKADVGAFCATLSLGEATKVLVDENAGRFMVTSARNYSEANPDVLKLSDITGCTFDIDEDVDEITRFDENGESVSCNPPRFKHSYNFFVTVRVNNPYFDDMRFKVNSRRVEIEELRGSEISANSGGVNLVIGALPSANAFNPEIDVEYRMYRDMCESIVAILLENRQRAREEIEAASAPKTALTCPYCGATTMPTATNCCEFCGGALGA